MSDYENKRPPSICLAAILTLCACNMKAQPYNPDLSKSIKELLAGPSPASSVAPRRTYSDQQLTAINAIPFGKYKPTVRQIVAHAKKAMVWITVMDGNRQQVAGGTGFFIDDGYGVLTNYHVIEKGKYFKAQSIVSGKTLSDGYVDDSNRACDLAVLRFRGYTNSTWTAHMIPHSTCGSFSSQRIQVRWRKVTR